MCLLNTFDYWLSKFYYAHHQTILFTIKSGTELFWCPPFQKMYFSMNKNWKTKSHKDNQTKMTMNWWFSTVFNQQWCLPLKNNEPLRVRANTSKVIKATFKTAGLLPVQEVLAKCNFLETHATPDTALRRFVLSGRWMRHCMCVHVHVSVHV